MTDNHAKRLLNASASAVLEVSSKGIIEFASDPIEGLFGYIPTEVIGKSIEVLIPQNKRQGHQSYFTGFLQNPKNRSMGMGGSFPGLHKAGHEIYVSIGLSILKNDDANSIVVTITESNLLNQVSASLKDKELEASLNQDENARLLSMVYHSQNIIMLVEPNLEIQWVNKAISKTLGYADHEILGEHPLFCLSTRNNPDEVKILNQALETNLIYSGNIIFDCKDGSTKWTSLHIYPNFEDERFLGFVFHINDIDELQRLIEETSRQNDTLESTAKIARLGTWELDLQTNDLYWSNEVYNIHEIPPGTKIDVENAINYYAPEARSTVSDAIQKCMETGSKWDLELPFITAKNNPIWVRSVGYAEFSNGKPLRLKGAFQDITQLKNAVEASNTASRTKSLFLANMSHEIRTPINGVLGMTELLLATKLDEKQKEYAGIVKQSADSLLQLINDLLDFSKLEAGKLILRPNDFDLRDLVTEKVQWHVHAASKKGVAFSVDFSPNVPTIIHADDARLGQIINNLCSNAVKFTHSGGITLTVSLSQEQELTFSVVDTGIGLDDGQLKAIFEEFEQVDNSSTRKYSGTGLGLSISEQLVALMKGKIWVQSQLGTGSIFSFTLPFMKAESDHNHSLKSQSIAPTLFVMESLSIKSQLDAFASRQGLDYVVFESAGKAISELKRSQRWQNVVVFAEGIANPKLADASLKRFVSDNSDVIWVGNELSLNPIEDTVDCFRPMLDIPLGELNTQAFNELLTAVFVRLVKKRESGAAESPLHGLQVLIVEDNDINQTVFIEMLRQFDMQITLANDGVEAIAKVKQDGPFDLVIMDCQMPVMDGYEATKVIRKMADKALSEQIIVAATAHGMEDELNRCLNVGMNDYLVKPFTQEQLVSALLRNLT